MNFDSYIIQYENEIKAEVWITDNHRSHIKGHLKYLYKPRVFFHVLNHLWLWVEQKHLMIPAIELDQIMERVRRN